MAAGAGTPVHHVLAGAPPPTQGQSTPGRLGFSGTTHARGQFTGNALRSVGLGADVDG